MVFRPRCSIDCKRISHGEPTKDPQYNLNITLRLSDLDIDIDTVLEVSSLSNSTVAS